MIEVTEDTIRGLNADIDRKALKGEIVYAENVKKYVMANPALIKEIDRLAREIQDIASSNILPPAVQDSIAYAAVRNGAWFVIEAILRQEDINLTNEIMGE